jgi:hypothetical protein
MALCDDAGAYHSRSEAVIDKGHTQQHAEDTSQGLDNPQGPQPAAHAKVACAEVCGAHMSREQQGHKKGSAKV